MTEDGYIEPEKWFRYIDPWAAGEEPYLQLIPVKRHTPKGVWLNEFGVEKFVLKDARRRYAYPTEALALDSYIRRKKAQIQHASNTHDRAVENLAAAERIARGEAAPKQDKFSFAPWL